MASWVKLTNVSRLPCKPGDPGPLHREDASEISIARKSNQFMQKFFMEPAENPLYNFKFFPSFDELPPKETILPSKFFKEGIDGIHRSAYTWCFIGEIHSDCLALKEIVRNRIGVKDRTDDCPNIPVMFHAVDGHLNYYDLKKGFTVVIQNGEYHHFMDGTVGFRVENLDAFRVVKLSLEDVFKASEVYFKHRNKTCWICNKNAQECEGERLKHCSTCGYANYCSKTCQAEDWKKGPHKAWCKEMGKVANLVDLNYAFDDFNSHCRFMPPHFLDVVRQT